MDKKNRLFTLVDEILYYKWDPIAVSDSIAWRDEYHTYVPKICEYLLSNQSQEYIAKHLYELETSSMGLTVTDKFKEKHLKFLFKIASMLVECKEYLEE